MKSLQEQFNDLKKRWEESETVHQVYESRWVWYHTILAFMTFALLIVEIGIMIILAVKL